MTFLPVHFVQGRINFFTENTALTFFQRCKVCLFLLGYSSQLLLEVIGSCRKNVYITTT